MIITDIIPIHHINDLNWDWITGNLLAVLEGVKMDTPG